VQFLERHRIFLYQNYLLYAIAFFIPLFPKIVPVLIIAFGVLSGYAIAKKYSRVEMSEISILMILFYLLHGVGLIYTENLPRGWFDMEVKLSLLAFPIAFVGFKFVNTTNFTQTLRMFMYGSLAAAAFCLAQSLIKVTVMDMGYYHLLTSRFSVIVHPSYFAMYLIFSILILMYIEWPLIHFDEPRLSARNVGVLLFLSLSVILTGSKTGFIMWAFVMLFVTGVLTAYMRHKWIPIVGFVIVSSMVGVIFENAPLLQSRIINVLEVAGSESVDPETTESTALRYLVYSSSWEIIQSQDWYGQGTGDFQLALDELYNERGFTKAASQHLNAHNLFLQTGLALGIPGFSMIVGIFLMMFIQGFRYREYLFVGFTLMFLIISFTESVFNVQAGVVFFSFFTVLLARRSANA